MATRAFLTNEHHNMPADSSGAVESYAGASTHVVVYLNATDDTSNWTFTRVNDSGITSTLSGNLLTITSMSTDTGYVNISAHKTGQTSISLRMSLLKIRRS